MSRDDLSAI